MQFLCGYFLLLYPFCFYPIRTLGEGVNYLAQRCTNDLRVQRCTNDPSLFSPFLCVQVNDELVAGYSKDKATKLLKNSPKDRISVAVRDRPFERTITMQKDSQNHVGFLFRGNEIYQIVKDSSAARCVCVCVCVCVHACVCVHVYCVCACMRLLPYPPIPVMEY